MTVRLALITDYIRPIHQWAVPHEVIWRIACVARSLFLIRLLPIGKISWVLPLYGPLRLLEPTPFWFPLLEVIPAVVIRVGEIPRS